MKIDLSRMDELRSGAPRFARLVDNAIRDYGPEKAIQFSTGMALGYAIFALDLPEPQRTIEHAWVTLMHVLDLPENQIEVWLVAMLEDSKDFACRQQGPFPPLVQH
jgi:hypothetical protein